MTDNNNIIMNHAAAAAGPHAPLLPSPQVGCSRPRAPRPRRACVAGYCSTYEGSQLSTCSRRWRQRNADFSVGYPEAGALKLAAGLCTFRPARLPAAARSCTSPPLPQRDMWESLSCSPGCRATILRGPQRRSCPSSARAMHSVSHPWRRSVCLARPAAGGRGLKLNHNDIVIVMQLASGRRGGAVFHPEARAAGSHEASKQVRPGRREAQWPRRV